ncbi:MAG TPA: GxxExxY protein [Phycisphaerales bacterium]|nr:GxxExxY protein [Phycisphaerales bacterium]
MYDDRRRSGPSSFGAGHGGGAGGGGGNRRGVPLSELDPALTAVSHKVIGCARDVHMTMGQGHDKAVYIAALKREFDTQGISYAADAPFTVRYKDHAVGTTVADLHVDRRFLVEVLSQPGEVDSWQRLQLRAKLKAADVDLGLILNFGGRLMKDGLVRVLNPDKIKGLQEAGEPGAHDFDGNLH